MHKSILFILFSADNQHGDLSCADFIEFQPFMNDDVGTSMRQTHTLLRCLLIHVFQHDHLLQTLQYGLSCNLHGMTLTLLISDAVHPLLNCWIQLYIAIYELPLQLVPLTHRKCTVRCSCIHLCNIAFMLNWLQLANHDIQGYRISSDFLLTGATIYWHKIHDEV